MLINFTHHPFIWWFILVLSSHKLRINLTLVKIEIKGNIKFVEQMIFHDLFIYLPTCRVSFSLAQHPLFFYPHHWCFRICTIIITGLGNNHLPWCTPKLLHGFNYESKSENNERRRIWGAFPSSQHFRGRGVCWSSKMGLGRLTNNSIIYMDLHKSNNKLVSA